MPRHHRNSGQPGGQRCRRHDAPDNSPRTRHAELPECHPTDSSSDLDPTRSCRSAQAAEPISAFVSNRPLPMKGSPPIPPSERLHARDERDLWWGERIPWISDPVSTALRTTTDYRQPAPAASRASHSARSGQSFTTPPLSLRGSPPGSRPPIADPDSTLRPSSRTVASPVKRRADPRCCRPTAQVAKLADALP